MDYKSELSMEEKIIICNSIENHITKNDYENAFHLFILQISRMNYKDRDDFIYYFHKYVREKYSNIN